MIGLGSGNYNLSIVNLNSNFTATPTTHYVSFNGETEIIEDKDFCITSNQQFEDLNIDIFPLEDAIPGFETDYQLVINNNGAQNVQNAQVNFNFDNNFQSYVTSTISPSSSSSNVLSSIR